MACTSLETGAIDLREDQSYYRNWKPVRCKLCVKIRTKEELDRTDNYYGWVTSALWVPDAVKEFLGVKWLCERCIAQIDWIMKRTLKACWGRCPSEVIQLAIVIVIKNQLTSEANHDIWQSQTITRALRNKEDISEWTWATQDKINEATRRLART